MPENACSPLDHTAIVNVDITVLKKSPLATPVISVFSQRNKIYKQPILKHFKNNKHIKCLLDIHKTNDISCLTTTPPEPEANFRSTRLLS